MTDCPIFYLEPDVPDCLPAEGQVIHPPEELTCRPKALCRDLVRDPEGAVDVLAVGDDLGERHQRPPGRRSLFRNPLHAMVFICSAPG